MGASRPRVCSIGSPLRRLLVPAVLLAAAVSPGALADGRGVYDPLPLKDNEERLLQNAGAYEDLFLRRGYRYEAPGLEALLGRVGAALAPRPTDPYIRYRFHILRDPEPNAFALPDGQVYVNTGMLAGLENEAQLAALLAHEVQHTAGHHGVLSYRSARRKIITSMVLGPLTLGVGDVFLALSVVGYSRDLEDEADRFGIRRMHEAGYDPRQMARLFEMFGGDPEGEVVETRSKWSDHPALHARVETAKALAPELLRKRSRDLRVNAQAYRRLARQVGLDTVQDLIASDYPRAALEMARWLLGEDASDAGRHLALADAYLALGAREARVGDLTNREKRSNLWARWRDTREEREEKRRATEEGQRALRTNMESARRSYLRALELDSSLPEAHRGLGFALEGLGRPREAGKEFVAYLRARPGAADRELILDRMREINRTIKNGGKGP